MNRSRSSASSVASGAAALLQKARGHLRGQSFGLESKSSSLTSQKHSATKEDDEDDVAAYLSQLSKKTSGMRKPVSMAADDVSSSLSDLSLSDDKGSHAPSQPASSSQQFSKFLKKSSTSSVSKSQSSLQGSQKSSTAAHHQASSIAKRPSSSFTSSALQRASKLSAKITARSKGMTAPLDSDSSDTDLAGPASKQKAGTGPARVASGLMLDDAPEMGDGNRFLKKSTSKGPGRDASASKPEPEAKPSSGGEESDDDFPMRSLHARDSMEVLEAAKPRRTKTLDSLVEKQEPFQTSTPSAVGKAGKKKGGVYDRIMAQLDTDEEDVAELIGGISQASSPEPVVTPVKKEVKKRAVTPYKPAVELSDDESEIVTPATSPEPKVQAMTIEDLEPAALDLSSVHSEGDTSIAEEVSLGPTFSGLQTVDDLLQFEEIRSPSPQRDQRNDTPVVDSYQDDFESVSERTISPVMRPSPSPKPILAEETSLAMSIASSIPEVEDKSVADSYSPDFSQASSSRHSTRSRSSASSRSRSSRSSRSRSSRSRGSSTNSRTRSRTPDTSRSVSSISSGKSKSKSKSGDYSEDFDTASHGTDSEEKTITSDFSTSHSGSSHKTTSVSSRSAHRHHRGRSRRKAGQDAAVQTSSSLHSMQSHWLKDYDFQTPGYFKMLSANLHDTMSHSVDPKVLETLTSFDPSALDYHASLLKQVQQTRLAVTNTLRQHQAFLESLEENYAYTTLEETKLFIKRQKKRRRRREEETGAALQEVDMNVESL
ncbi:uncharacterized protein [Diadema antillarum]|uniref:uncharacterized protein n=1 Tax=Diadema antillarum TaxID=105358 RepID=UPI003A844103